MRKSIALCLMLLVAVSCATPERNCAQYRTGTFTFTSLVDGKEETTTFTREDAIEIETFNGNKDTATVRWINDCEYILKKINPKNRAEEKSIHIKILTTSNSSYTFEYNAVGSSQKFRGEAFKIH
ncbi:MAG: DNA topoisomerase IV [Allomuricauda sp.]|nr:MAG: DNA topoisomerase IV [Allomuricauda sp.]